MPLIELVRSDAEYAFGEFIQALNGVTEGQAWAVLPQLGSDYLHTDGSIFGMVMHVATCKRAYASICFRDTEVRWRDIADEVERFEPSWLAALEYLEKAHEYWMASWAHLDDETLFDIRPTNWKDPRPAWKIFQITSQHDSYHAGQIAVLRYGCPESDQKPPSVAEDIRKYCRESVHW